MLGRHPAGGTGATLAERIGLDHSIQPAALELEQADDERGLAAHDRVRLQAREAELAVDRRHDRKRAVVESDPASRHVLDRARREPPASSITGTASPGVSRRSTSASVR